MMTVESCLHLSNMKNTKRMFYQWYSIQLCVDCLLPIRTSLCLVINKDHLNKSGKYVLTHKRFSVDLHFNFDYFKNNIIISLVDFQRLENRLFTSWTSSSGMDCKQIGPETPCFCQHRYELKQIKSSFSYSTRSLPN